MTTPDDTSNKPITLEMIRQQKAEKLAEIRASKQRISESARQLFRPVETAGGASMLVNNFSSGIAIFNGVMTGFKIIKRIRSLFKRKQ